MLTNQTDYEFIKNKIQAMKEMYPSLRDKTDVLHLQHWRLGIIKRIFRKMSWHTYLDLRAVTYQILICMKL